MKTFLKRRSVIAVSCVALGLVAIAGLLLARPRSMPRGTLELTGYKRWPGGHDVYAELRLVNNTTNTIYYLMMQGSTTPAALFSEHTPNGWSPVQWEAYAMQQTLVKRKLLPGKSVELAVPLTPGALPKRIALQCENLPPINRSPFEARFRTLAAPLCRFLNIKMSTPGMLAFEDERIWCEEIIDPTKSQK